MPVFDFSFIPSSSIFLICEVIPVQVTPKSFHILVSFIIFCHFLKIQPQISLFQAFFMLKRHPKVRGWQFLSTQHKHAFLHGLPFSIHDWKNGFFFVTSNQPWGIHWIWRQLSTSLNKNDRILESDEENFFKLCSIEVPPPRGNSLPSKISMIPS